MNTLVILIKILNMLLIANIIYKLMFRRQTSSLNITYFMIIIVLSFLISLFSNLLEVNIFLFLLLIIILMILSNISLKENYESSFILIRNGKLNIKELLNSRISLKNVLVKVKEKGFDSLNEIDLAILESDGTLSFFVKFEKNSFSLIVNGRVNYDILKKLNKNSRWLDDELKKRDILLAEVIYAFFSNNFLYIIKK